MVKTNVSPSFATPQMQMVSSTFHSFGSFSNIGPRRWNMAITCCIRNERCHVLLCKCFCDFHIHLEIHLTILSLFHAGVYTWLHEFLRSNFCTSTWFLKSTLVSYVAFVVSRSRNEFQYEANSASTSYIGGILCQERTSVAVNAVCLDVTHFCFLSHTSNQVMVNLTFLHFT